MRRLLSLSFGLLVYVTLPQSALALVNINSASLDELDTLPYIGTSTAQLIISGRPYSSTSDIQRVSGFGGGPGTRNYDSVIGLITITGNTTVPTEAVADSTSNTGGTLVEAKKTNTPGPILSLSLTVPERAYAGQLLSFDVNPSDGKGSRVARYQWNFGDGNTYDFKTPTYRYSRPGTYVVMVKSYYQKETKLARKEIEILPLALKLDALSQNDVKITNNGNSEIDLGSMSLVANSTFTFPKYTILLADQSLEVKVSNIGNVVLKDGEGVVLAQNTAETKFPPRPASVISRQRTVAKVSTPLESSSTEEALIGSSTVGAGEGRANSKSQAASLPAADVPAAAWSYLALFAVMGLGIFGLYNTRS